MKLQTKSGVEGVCLGLAQLKGGHEELGNHSKAVIGDNPDAPFLADTVVCTGCAGKKR